MSIFSLFSRFYTCLNPPENLPAADARPLKFGILGAAWIAPNAIILPARNHPETVVYAVAARDKARATAFAKKHKIEKVYGGPNSYQELIDDPEIDAIYNPLPNALHYEWTMKALAAGKHVLLEKPAADTAEETRQMFDFAEKKGVVLLEAFHYRFHPAAQRVKAIIDSKELGAIKHISARLATLGGYFKSDDIRFNYALGGGSLMDMGCYTLNVIRYLSSSNPTSVISAEHALHIPVGSSPAKPNVDRRTIATLALPNDATATLKCDLGLPWTFGLFPPLPQLNAIITLEGGEIELSNFVFPTYHHSIKVTTKSAGNKTKTRTEKVYTFADGNMEGNCEAWWSTYRFQLEAFVDRVKGRKPQTWIEKEDSIANMHWIEQIYAKSGLGSRPKSDFVPQFE
ncbi:hypothetical protein H0H92_015330 [Tricholoma furcatifolium]|nr:hypothetical protein H0H92_015330 [Tricholoma furcatifolium]